MEWALTVFGLIALASIIGFIGFWAVCKAGANEDKAMLDRDMRRDYKAVLKSEEEKEKNEN
jgi:hypothetical protein